MDVKSGLTPAERDLLLWLAIFVECELDNYICRESRSMQLQGLRDRLKALHEESQKGGAEQ